MSNRSMIIIYIKYHLQLRLHLLPLGLIYIYTLNFTPKLNKNLYYLNLTPKLNKNFITVKM